MKECSLYQRHRRLHSQIKKLTRKMGLSPIFLINVAFLHFVEQDPAGRAQMLANYAAWIENRRGR